MSGIDNTSLFALTAAAFWGGGDFCGGMSSRSVSGDLVGTMRLVMLAQGTSLTALLGLLAWQHAALPHGAAVLWALLAGMCGVLGSVAFFKAISRGNMGAPAAVSGLLAAAIPAVVSSGIEGAPGSLRLAGFVAAAIAIWLVAAGGSTHGPRVERSTMALAAFSGAVFGLYFVALKLANPLGELMPVALARMGGLSLLGLILIFHQRQKTVVQPWSVAWRSTGWRSTAWRSTGWRWAMGLALLDTGGNLLFVAATRLGRLDVASVLASLYPAGTILLAAWHLHERPTRRQVVGMFTALVAVVMITL